jgi:hypothetical protein
MKCVLLLTYKPITTMPLYKIYHPVNGMNHRCLQGVYEYYEVCQVEAATLNKVFVIGQNGFSDEYTAIGTRSTSVGDIIVDVEEDKHYMVMGVGFQEIPSTVTQWSACEDEDFSSLELDWEIQDEEEDEDPSEDYEESDDDYQDRLERSWEKSEVILPKDITIDNSVEIASFDYYIGIAVAKKKGLVQTTDFQDVRKGTHFIVCCGDVMISVNSNEYREVARRPL